MHTFALLYVYKFVDMYTSYRLHHISMHYISYICTSSWIRIQVRGYVYKLQVASRHVHDMPDAHICAFICIQVRGYVYKFVDMYTSYKLRLDMCTT